MRGYKKSVSVGSFFIHKHISQLTQEGPIAFRMGSVPVPLRKPRATCDFPKGSGPPAPPRPLYPNHT